MPRWLFPNSLDDPTVYAKARQHWLDLWRSTASRFDPDRRWRTPWVENPSRDGNPIFTAVGESREIRIIQEDPRDPDDLDLDWWLDSAEDSTLPDGIAELVIACCPSVENTPEVERLLSDWLTTGRVRASLPDDQYSNGNGTTSVPDKLPLDSASGETGTSGFIA